MSGIKENARKRVKPTTSGRPSTKGRAPSTTERAVDGTFEAATAKQMDAFVEGLHTLYPDADCELDHDNALQLLIATILSAQSTDVRVNLVGKSLFAKYQTAANFADADPSAFEKEIQSTGFFRQKTKSVLGAAKMLVEHHGGKVPQTMEELIELPGVARKTANVVLGTVFGKAVGFVVDTHVRRLSNRLGLSRETDPVKIERDLMTKLPQNEWIFLGHAIIWHGRRVCAARKPRCHECALVSHCPRNGLPPLEAT